MSENIDAVAFKHLNGLPGMFEARRLRTYQCQRNTESGEVQDVTIQLEDHGALCSREHAIPSCC